MENVDKEKLMITLSESRKEKDAFLASDPDSPFTPEQRKNFQGLHYYPENPALRMELPIQEFPVKEKIEMMTSTGTSQTYHRFGKVHFKVENNDVELMIYRSKTGFFLPFVDSMAGKETYPAGRYLEPEPAGKGKFIIDFNLAYNPYCAYNDQWSCPLTPFENHIKVPIRAGEKLYHEVEMQA
jgi:uncharacterized protein (DUF1684 family)